MLDAGEKSRNGKEDKAGTGVLMLDRAMKCGLESLSVVMPEVVILHYAQSMKRY